MTPNQECEKALIREIDRLREQIAWIRQDRERLCAWAIHHGFSTGHADTVEQLLDELLPQIEERICKYQQMLDDKSNEAEYEK